MQTDITPHIKTGVDITGFFIKKSAIETNDYHLEYKKWAIDL